MTPDDLIPPDLPALLADSLRRDLAAFVDSVDEAGRDALASDPELRRAFGKVAASSRFVLETLTLEPGLLLTSGHYRNGVVLGAASAMLMAEMVMEQKPSLDPEPYVLDAEH